jgi:hypothetical protein
MPEFVALLPGVTPEDFPDGEAAAAEWVRLTTHPARTSTRPGISTRP